MVFRDRRRKPVMASVVKATHGIASRKYSAEMALASATFAPDEYPLPEYVNYESGMADLRELWSIE